MKELSFSSEDLLRQAIANLLSRMPGVSDVQILHGSQEHGKDIVFWTKGPLSEPLPCACVIKNEEISGSVDSNRGARTVLFQAEQALDTPFTNALGEEQRIHRVYVMSPAKISAATMNSIKGRLSIRSGQIVFVPGSKLFELFRAHWLDFFSDEYTSLESHLEKLRDQAKNNDLSQVTNLYGIASIKEEPISIYVERTLHRQLPMIDFDSVKTSLLPIPEPERLGKPFRRKEIAAIKAGIDSSAKSLEHLQRWGFIEKWRPLLDRAQKFARELESSKWQNATNASESETVVIASSTLRSELSFIESDAQSVFEQVVQICDSGLGLKHRRLLTMTDLLSPEAVQLGSLDDCIRSSPTKVLTAKDQVKISIDELEVRRSMQSIMVVGAAGYGKTSFCRWNALLDAQEFRNGSNVLPVYVPLHQLSNNKAATFEEAFLKAGGKSALIGDHGEAHRIRLYLDGLDEVPSAAQRRHLVALARQAHESDKHVQIILTARDYIIAPWLSWLPKLYLSDLGQQSQDELAERWFRESKSVLRAFKAQLVKTSSLSDLMKVPLLATLIILVYKQTRSLPENKARLYSTFVELLSGGWDLAKGVLRSSRYGRSVKVMVLSQLAASAHSEGKKFFDVSMVNAAIRSVVSKISKQEMPELTSELLMDGILARSADEFFFAHLSFQEFLCAKHFLALPNNRTHIDGAIEDYLDGEDWWREVVRFYLALSENPRALAEWLLVRLNNSGVDNRAREIWEEIENAFPSFSLARWLEMKTGYRERPLLPDGSGPQ
jgi:hypothetical protein